MAKSKATGDPAKAGRYTSAGLRLACPVSSGLLGRSKPAFSRSGRSPAGCAQLWTKSRTAWCRWVRSPPATHIPAWWLWWSSTASHKGHQVSDSASGMRRRTRSSQKKAAGSIRVRPAGTAYIIYIYIYKKMYTWNPYITLHNCGFLQCLHNHILIIDSCVTGWEGVIVCYALLSGYRRIPSRRCPKWGAWIKIGYTWYITVNGR